MKKFVAILVTVLIGLVFSFVGCKGAVEEAVEEVAEEVEEVAEEVEEVAEEVEEVAEEAAEEVTEEKKFGLADVPEIENKETLNLICETGGVFDKIVPYIEKFTEQTGIEVTVER